MASCFLIKTIAMTNNKENKIDIALSEQVASGVYSNLQIVQHSPTEFIIDFVEVMPNVPKAQVKSRIILNPVHAKKMLNALAENIQRYEMNFGKIKDVDAQVLSSQYTEINPMGKA